MTAREAIAYIENYTWSATRLGLERTKALLAALGDPQKKLKFVHVAGSNGKGSTCTMLDAILRRAGYKTGLYISPYIQDFCERMQVNGQNIPGGTLAALTERVRAIADGMEDHPSQFELVTAIAMEYFAQEKCDVVVLEVGMGGELDSTNAIDAPEVAVITNIGLEHTEYLGDTLEKIARTKAGIIKPGCACVCYDGAAEVTGVIRQVCAGRGVPFRLADSAALTPLEHDLNGQRFRRHGQIYELSLLGAHQLRNAAVALETVEALCVRKWNICETAVREGLADVRWPARFEVLGREPLFILDGGHNPQCAQALADILADYLPGRKVTFLMGVLADKDWHAMLESVRPFAARFLCVTPDSPRALPAAELAAYLRDTWGVETEAFEQIEDAVRAALASGSPTVAFGSLYMAGAIRTAFRPAYRRQLRRAKIQARDSLGAREREALSAQIAERILASPEFRRAKTVLLYRAAKGEAQLEALERAPEAWGKRLVYPLCAGEGEMTALLPQDEDAWAVGHYGILEPVPERSQVIPPEEIDLVLCPCTVFDERGGRMGMGAGYYDRYLPKCVNAVTASAAFEVQKTPLVPAEPWDRPVDLVFTERAVYRNDP